MKKRTFCRSGRQVSELMSSIVNPGRLVMRI